MIHLTRKIPEWLFKRLPTRLARQCIGKTPIPIAASIPSEGNLQLLVDVSVIYQSDARTGIQRVVRALLLQLLESPPAGYRVLPIFATRQRSYCYANPEFLTNHVRERDESATPVQVKTGDIFLGLDLAAHLLPRHQSQLLDWKIRGVRLHVMVYDLLPLLHPEWFNSRTTKNFKRWIKWLALYADNAICISNTVTVELSTWLNARYGFQSEDLRCTTIILGADIDASAPSDGLPHNAENLLAHLRGTPSVLMVGTLEPRKGYDQVLAAFEQLWQQVDAAPSLILVGRPGWKTEVLQNNLRNHPEYGRRLFWLEHVSDEFLTHLYSTCSGVLVASRGEGFGLPLIEAASHGKPVLTRNLPVFREMDVSGLTYFDSETPHGLAVDLINWLRQPALYSEKNIYFPTWKNSASQLLRALNLQRQTENFDHRQGRK